MKKNKIAVLRVKEKSTWVSCQTISKNLLSAYERIAEKSKIPIEFCHYSGKSLSTDGEKMFAQLQKNRVNRIVIIDHFPYPGKMFEELEPVFDKLNYYPEIFVHVYGCLMHWFHEVDHKSTFFKKCKIHFVTASRAQRDLLSQYLAKSVPVSVINFPLDTAAFRLKKTKESLRKELGFAKDDILLIYAGRAHMQKNLPLLLQSVSSMMNKNPKIKFLFAGQYDDGPINFLEYRFGYGTNRELVQEAVKNGGIEKNFIELGNLPRAELLKYLRASDVFCSLSMYNDEDYGYAPLEALSSGCAVLLSRWGGYKEFDSPYTSFVKVSREHVNKADSLFINPGEVRRQLQELLQRLPSNPRDVQDFVEERFSISAVAEQISDLHGLIQPVTVSFNPKKFVEFKKWRSHPLHPYNYLEIYKSYYQ